MHLHHLAVTSLQGLARWWRSHLEQIEPASGKQESSIHVLLYCMVCIRLHIVCIWSVYGLNMVCIWFVYWSVYDLYMVCILSVYGLNMVCILPAQQNALLI